MGAINEKEPLTKRWLSGAGNGDARLIGLIAFYHDTITRRGLYTHI